MSCDNESHDVITWFYCTCFCDGRFKRFNWPGSRLWWQQVDSHVEVGHVELAKHPRDNPPGPVHWTSLLSDFFNVRLTWIDMDWHGFINWSSLHFDLHWISVFCGSWPMQTYCTLYIAPSSKLWYSWYQYLWYVLVQSDAIFWLALGLRCKVLYLLWIPIASPISSRIGSKWSNWSIGSSAGSSVLLWDTWTCPWCPWTCHSVWKGRPSTQWRCSSTQPKLIDSRPSRSSGVHEFDCESRHSTALVGTFGSRSRIRCTTTAFRGTERTAARPESSTAGQYSWVLRMLVGILVTNFRWHCLAWFLRYGRFGRQFRLGLRWDFVEEHPAPWSAFSSCRGDCTSAAPTTSWQHCLGPGKHE